MHFIWPSVKRGIIRTSSSSSVIIFTPETSSPTPKALDHAVHPLLQRADKKMKHFSPPPSHLSTSIRFILFAGVQEQAILSLEISSFSDSCKRTPLRHNEKCKAFIQPLIKPGSSPTLIYPIPYAGKQKYGIKKKDSGDEGWACTFFQYSSTHLSGLIVLTKLIIGITSRIIYLGEWRSREEAILKIQTLLQKRRKMKWARCPKCTTHKDSSIQMEITKSTRQLQSMSVLGLFHNSDPLALQRIFTLV